MCTNAFYVEKQVLHFRIMADAMGDFVLRQVVGSITKSKNWIICNFIWDTEPEWCRRIAVLSTVQKFWRAGKLQNRPFIMEEVTPWLSGENI